MDNIILYKKLASLPENLKKEVADFIELLKTKNKKNFERNKPISGSGKGMFVIMPDFDEPLEDFNDYI